MKRQILFAIVALFCFAIIANGQSAKKLKPWQTSWTTFVSVFNACIKSKTCNHKTFIGKDVFWEGTVKSIDFAKAGIGLEMGDPPIQDKNGLTADVLAFFILPKVGDSEKWKTVKVDDKIRFKTKLGDGFSDSVVSFLPILQTQGGKEVKIALFNTTGGKLMASTKK